MSTSTARARISPRPSRLLPVLFWVSLRLLPALFGAGLDALRPSSPFRVFFATSWPRCFFVTLPSGPSAPNFQKTKFKAFEQHAMHQYLVLNVVHVVVVFILFVLLAWFSVWPSTDSDFDWGLPSKSLMSIEWVHQQHAVYDVYDILCSMLFYCIH